MKRVFRGLALSLLGIMLCGVLAFHALTVDLPSPDALLTRASTGNTRIFDRQGQLLYEIIDPHSGARTRLTLPDIPATCRQATLATEDAEFYSNPGIDVPAILRAVWQNTQSGEIVSGGSTITQQLARMLLLSADERAERTLTRKLREAVLAVRLAQRFSKDELLTLYFNEVYYGNLAYGLEAAAQAYFGTSANNLDLAQCALLAGLPQRPAFYNPLIALEVARQRQRVVLNLMVDHGYLIAAEADRAAEEPLRFRSASNLLAPHFVAYVRQQLEDALGADELIFGEWTITTTLDLNLQRAAEESITRHLAELREHDVSSAAVVVLDPDTGEILAMVGSADYNNAAIDGAVNAAISLRQPGSAMKPILYALAFERGWSPGDVVYDVPTAFIDESGEAYLPANYDNVFHGPVSLRQALANSYNLPAVILQKHIGTRDFLELARRMGLTTLTDAKRYGLTLTLGGGEVQLLDLTAAYGVFANGGNAVQPCAIRQITHRALALTAENADGYESSPSFAISHAALCSPSEIKNQESDMLLDPRAVAMLTDVLSDKVARAEQFGLFSPLRLPFPAAAKTGTTSNYRDNWTMGYTPQRVVGVWVGNPDGHPMQSISGVAGAGPIWHDVMLAAQQQLPIETFVEPVGLERREVCVTNGLTPGPACSYRRTELYLAESPLRPVEHEYAHVNGNLIWHAPAELRAWASEHNIAFVQDARDGQGARQMTPADADCRQQAATCVLVTMPTPDTHLRLDAHLPREMQQLEISVVIKDEIGAKRVDILVDGVMQASSGAAPYRAWWTLRPGEHHVVAVAVDGDDRRWESAPIVVTVE